MVLQGQLPLECFEFWHVYAFAVCCCRGHGRGRELARRRLSGASSKCRCNEKGVATTLLLPHHRGHHTHCSGAREGGRLGRARHMAAGCRAGHLVQVGPHRLHDPRAVPATLWLRAAGGDVPSLREGRRRGWHVCLFLRTGRLSAESPCSPHASPSRCAVDWTGDLTWQGVSSADKCPPACCLLEADWPAIVHAKGARGCRATD